MSLRINSMNTVKRLYYICYADNSISVTKCRSDLNDLKFA